jgi:hypothetical protein
MLRLRSRILENMSPSAEDLDKVMVTVINGIPRMRRRVK